MTKKIRILHLEDMRSDAEIVKREMTKSSINLEWHHASNKEQFQKALVTFRPDIILSDHTLPGYSSIHALQFTRQHGFDIPFILVTATVSEEFAVGMIKEGCADYLLKDRLQRLPSAVLGALERWEREKEKEAHLATIIKSENRFRSLIENSHDMLTLFDETGKVEYISPSVERTFGYLSNEDRPKNANDLIYHEDLQKGETLVQMAFANPGMPIFAILRNRRKDGEYIWVEGTLTNLLHMSGVNAFVSNFRDITERKQSEDTIRKSEANLNAIIENSDVNIYSLDKDLRYITFNSLLKNTVSGIYNMDINVGDHVINFLSKLDPAEAHEWKNIYAEALLGKSLKFEKKFEVGNFTGYTSFSINPIWKDNSVIGLSCFARDVTEQKLAQEKLSQSEERYRNIVETAQEGIWIIDENDKTNFVNKKLCEIFGYTEQEMMGKSLQYFMDDEGKQLANGMDLLQKRIAHEPVNLRFVTKEGKTVWTNFSNSQLLNGQGKYIGALAMVTDITNQKMDEELLRKSEANIRSIFDNTYVAYVLLDRDFKILSFNQVAVEMYEKELGKRLKQGENLLNYFSGERRTRLEIKYKQVMQSERINYETYFIDPDDSIFYYNIQMSPVFDTNHNTLGLVIAVTDITQRKELELHRERITADLVQRNNDLEQFAYIVSHNLRAPVANILGISNVLDFPDLPDQVKKEAIAGVTTSAKRLDDVIKDLSNVLQVKREVSERKEVVYFSELVDDIQSSITSIIEKEEVIILTDFKSIDKLLTTRSYLHSIFYNLISNSIKYRQPNVCPIIEIKSLITKKGMELIFKDNCMGIDMERYGDKVFGLYKRFHSWETEGKGLGLFMVKTQVETLGGKISVTSAVNIGSEFKIEFNI